MVCAKPGPNDAAHIRSGSLFYGKRSTGFGEKASDCWTLPLFRAHHAEQHRGNELAFWRLYGINPFLEAKRLYGDRVAPTPKPASARPLISSTFGKPCSTKTAAIRWTILGDYTSRTSP